MSNRAIVLFSGGLDSTVLLHYVLKELKEDVICLYFDHEQDNYYNEFPTFINQVIKLQKEGFNVDYKVEKVPILNRFDKKIEYIPWRNLIFIAHASSFAEANNVNKIYCGFIDPEADRYKDTTESFIDNMNRVLEDSDIEVVAPFIDLDKLQVAHLGKYLGIKMEETWSCVKPIDGKECGTCGNCLFREKYDYVFEDTLNSIWANEKCSEKFIEKFYKVMPNSANLLLNNKCNTACKHCFYEFTNNDSLPLINWLNIVDKLVEGGINHIHFSGREPLLSDDLYYINHYIKSQYPGVRRTIVTNGILFGEKTELIEEMDFDEIGLSLSFDSNIRRDVEKIEDIINRFADKLVIYLSISNSNYKEIDAHIEHLYELGIKNFWVYPILHHGKAEETGCHTNPFSMYYVVDKLKDFCFPDLCVHIDIKGNIFEPVLDDDLRNVFYYSIGSNCDNMFPNVNLHFEMFCKSYTEYLTITADGYLVGCGMEAGKEYYRELSPGRVLDNSLEDLIVKGKGMTLIEIAKNRCFKEMDTMLCQGGCIRDKFCYMGC